MGRLRTRTERLERLLPDPTGKADGLVVTTTSQTDENGNVQYGYDLEAPGGGGGIASVTSADGSIVIDNTDPDNPDLSGKAYADAGDAATLAAAEAYTDSLVIHTPGCVFSNGNLLLSGTLTSEVQIPYAGTITGWTIAGDAAGSASIIVSHATYSTYDTMTTLFTATVTTAKKNQASGLSYAVSAGDILRFSGGSFSGFTRCSIVLTVSP